MKLATLGGMVGIALAALSLVASTPVRSEAVPAAAIGSFWELPAGAGQISLVMPGQAAPVVTSVSDTTVFGGVCLDCMLPLEFKATQSSKNCLVCGCSVSNASCIAGKTLKDGTWQSMMKSLPQGVGLVPVFVDPTKPESGLKKLTVNLRSVILPVTGLDSLTANQLLALVKPIGGTKAELLDSGKILSVTLKVDYTTAKAALLQKAIAAANGKVSVPVAL